MHLIHNSVLPSGSQNSCCNRPSKQILAMLSTHGTAPMPSLNGTRTRIQPLGQLLSTGTVQLSHTLAMFLPRILPYPAIRLFQVYLGVDEMWPSGRSIFLSR